MVGEEKHAVIFYGTTSAIIFLSHFEAYRDGSFRRIQKNLTCIF